MDRYKITYKKIKEGAIDESVAPYHFIVRTYPNIDYFKRKLEPWLQAFDITDERWLMVEAVNIDSKERRQIYMSLEEKFSEDPLFV